MDHGAPLTTGDVASICHVSNVTVFRWIKKGILKAYSTPGGHYRVRMSDLEEFLEKQGMPDSNGRGHNGKSTKSVLLVDDDPTVLELLKRILSSDDSLALDTASSGYEACIKIGATCPDLIVVDLFMPGFDGFSVIREVRANPKTCNVRILVLSGYGNEENRSRAREYGADEFLEKPVDRAALIERLKAML